MKPIVVPVMMAAHHPATLPCQKELRFGIGIKRMLLAVQQLFHRDSQLRHPIRIITVDFERKFHEFMERLLAIYCRDFNTYQS